MGIEFKEEAGVPGLESLITLSGFLQLRRYEMPFLDLVPGDIQSDVAHKSNA